MKSGNWYAWIDLMPPTPDELHVTGEIVVGNPGVEASLTAKEPQGINPTILLLELHLVQKPGMWPQVISRVQARYDRTICPGTERPRTVTVLHNGEEVASMEVNEVH